ncbi:MAG: LD-carboxypeptidase [Prevotella sp.]|nr:LD-carboxypeptidase [Prevotella sp.]
MSSKIVKPRSLEPGDKIALVSPAYWIPEEIIMQTAKIIREWGFRPVIAPHTSCLNVEAYSGTADERAADLMWAVQDSTIKAILCTRGGYGTIHLLGRIPQETFLDNPKWVIGHGDITMLLYTLASTGVACIHGPMALQISSMQEPASTITRNILMGVMPQYHLPDNRYNRYGHAQGILIGGNLSSFATISGTKFQLSDNQDIILFIEEVEESLHVIDRLFYMLRLQDNFNRVRGIIFGDFYSIKFDLQFGSVEQMLTAHLHDMEIPVCCGFPGNSCLPFIEGAPCTLDVTPEGSLLTFDIEGPHHTYQLGRAEAPIMREEEASE